MTVKHFGEEDEIGNPYKSLKWGNDESSFLA